MGQSLHQPKRRPPLRKRLAKFRRAIQVVKPIFWRFTAGLLWLYAAGTVLGQKVALGSWIWKASVDIAQVLSRIGFSPSSPAALSTSFKLLWLFSICGFAWVQVVGFVFFYLPFFPVNMAFPKYRRLYKTEKAKASAKQNLKDVPPASGIGVVFTLAVWFALYGSTVERAPLAVALSLTLILFFVRVQRALYFAAPISGVRSYRTQAFIESCRRHLLQTIEKFKAGQISEISHISTAIDTSSWFLKLARYVSRWLYGHPAKRRTALIVLGRFMFNLASLGTLSILFWALAIRYNIAPLHVGFMDAFLASASRAIPGVPDPGHLAIPLWIQAWSSVTAWLVFVLYAGPVASLFPLFQERAIASTAEDYARILVIRRALRRFVELLKRIRQIAEEDPAVGPFAKLVILLRQQPDIRAFLLGQPEFLRSLANRSEEVELMRNLGVPIPDVDGLIRELPTPVEGLSSAPALFLNGGVMTPCETEVIDALPPDDTFALP